MPVLQFHLSSFPTVALRVLAAPEAASQVAAAEAVQPTAAEPGVAKLAAEKYLKCWESLLGQSLDLYCVAEQPLPDNSL